MSLHFYPDGFSKPSVSFLPSRGSGSTRHSGHSLVFRPKNVPPPGRPGFELNWYGDGLIPSVILIIIVRTFQGCFTVQLSRSVPVSSAGSAARPVKRVYQLFRNCHFFGASANTIIPKMSVVVNTFFKLFSLFFIFLVFKYSGAVGKGFHACIHRYGCDHAAATQLL